MGDEVLCVGLLGVFSVGVGDRIVADDAWRLRKARTLIKLLALAPERRLHVEQAAELLWAGRDPDSARNNLHQAIFAARRALDSIGLDGSRYLELREELILLGPEDPVRIDAVAFEELAAAAREQGEPGAYRSALEGFDAELLPADRYEDWSRERRDSLDELRLALEAELAELEQDSGPHRAGAGRPELPPQLTSFVGRERELAEAATLLRDARLLTLTGAGGCGKTRLALQLAGQRGEDFADGVWPVELAALGEPELVGPAIAQALDTRLASDRAPEVALAGHIGDRRQLLLLDNCEHLVEPVARLAEALLSRCPNLTVLATSREPLRIPGEVTWRVPSLSLPRLVPGAPAEESLEAESVRLFATRAAQAAPGFELGRRQRGRCRLPLPSPRRDAAGDRAGGGAGERPHSGSDRRAPRRLARPALGRAPHGDDPAADPAGDARLELRAARRRRAGAAAPARRVCRRLRAGGG